VPHQEISHADEEQLRILKQGADSWNAWRSQQAAGIQVDLREANLVRADLSEAKLSFANLIEANLGQTDLVTAKRRKRGAAARRPI
jgi:uncharacterized protein YjbI with pentapeptide repeats